MCAVESVKLVVWLKSDIAATGSTDFSQIQWLKQPNDKDPSEKSNFSNFVKTRHLNHQTKAFYALNSLVVFILDKNVDHVHHMTFLKFSQTSKIWPAQNWSIFVRDEQKTKWGVMKCGEFHSDMFSVLFQCFCMLFNLAQPKLRQSNSFFKTEPNFAMPNNSILLYFASFSLISFIRFSVFKSCWHLANASWNSVIDWESWSKV